LDIVKQLVKISKNVRVETIAISTDGKTVPLLVIGKPLPADRSALKNDKRLVLYIQANIHAGEVEGKEASLMFARELLEQKNNPLLDKLVILICPIFNPDGNDQISKLNRTHQNGPENGVGVRHNGMLLDMNRDAVKAETPEVRGLLMNVFNKWDPDIFVDCHTTNGSYHIEPVTFTWMVHPNSDKTLIDYMSSKLGPSVNRNLLDKYKVENCFYGEFASMTEPEKGWFFDAADARYITNYYGLRNRLAILDENYVYADYKSRVMGNFYLLKTIAEFAAGETEIIQKLIADADSRTVARGEQPAKGDSIAIEFKARPLKDKVTIKSYRAEIGTDQNGRRSFRKTDDRIDVTVPYYADFYPVRQRKFPYAYAITVNDPEVISLLRHHGIKMEKLAEKADADCERFVLTELKPSPRLNQGHYTNTVKGRYVAEKIYLKPGTVIIRTAQPLANVATCLLEPESNDGLLYWNFLDRYLAPQWGSGFNPYPVLRIVSPVPLKLVNFE
jgi:hypothetical protein